MVLTTLSHSCSSALYRETLRLPSPVTGSGQAGRCRERRCAGSASRPWAPPHVCSCTSAFATRACADCPLGGQEASCEELNGPSPSADSQAASPHRSPAQTRATEPIRRLTTYVDVHGSERLSVGRFVA